jgi:hypothetical protein
MRMRRSRLLLLAAACAVCCAQEQTASVAGAVTNSVTGEPITRAHVRVQRMENFNQQSYGAMTDAKGKFSIAQLPPGMYFAVVDKAGFYFPGANQLRLGPGGRQEDVNFTLVPTGAIVGRVVDSNEEPAEGIIITVLMGAGTVTDEKGQFRIGGLAPGKYRLLATPPKGPMGPEKRSDGTSEVHHAATYYPSSLEAKGAGRVAVNPGTETSGIGIRLVRTPIVRVSGRVSGVPAKAYARIMLRRGSTRDSLGSMVKPDGAFEIWRVDPGAYTLVAACDGPEQNLQSAPVEIEVGEANVDDVEFALLPPSDIQGTVQYEDEKAKPPASKTQAQQPRPPPNALTFRDIGGEPYGRSFRANIAADGSFSVSRVPPGRYLASPSWSNAYVRSMQLGPTPMQGSILDLRYGAGGNPLTVMLSSDLAEISGKVEDGAGATVMLVPVPFGGGFPTTRVGADQSYQVRAAPGKYQLVIMPKDESPAFVSRLDPEDSDDGIEITLAPGEKLTKDLKLPPKQ